MDGAPTEKHTRNLSPTDISAIIPPRPRPWALGRFTRQYIDYFVWSGAIIMFPARKTVSSVSYGSHATTVISQWFETQ